MKYSCVDNTILNKCSRCGQCCSNFLPMTKAEVKRLKEIAKRPETEVQIKYIGDKFYFMCPFLILEEGSKKTRCSIYKNRPYICKIFSCNKKPDIISIRGLDFELVDVMKDIINYDYQIEAGMTYKEALLYHLKNLFNDIESKGE